MMLSLRRYFFAGLLVWVPLGVTVLIVKFLVDLMDRSLVLLPMAYRPENLLGFKIPGLGVVLTVLVVLITGMVAANLFGRQLVRIGEDLLARIPLVRSIYSAVKQVLETLFSSSGQSFRRVVLVEYPRRDMWTLAFVTGTGVTDVENKVGSKLVNLFVPTTPNPTSGYFLMVPLDDVIDVNLSIDAGLKLIMSAGVVVPDGVAGKTAKKRK
ncbi:MAG TPA: DUF502 domain-containing protein [Acidiferrobacteraceae bacterium]|nr:DUF502 domain-containing protein [Acidiferrobacteraceae bacterium]